MHIQSACDDEGITFKVLNDVDMPSNEFHHDYGVWPFLCVIIDDLAVLVPPELGVLLCSDHGKL